MAAGLPGLNGEREFAGTPLELDVFADQSFACSNLREKHEKNLKEATGGDHACPNSLSGVLGCILEQFVFGGACHFARGYLFQVIADESIEARCSGHCISLMTFPFPGSALGGDLRFRNCFALNFRLTSCVYFGRLLRMVPASVLVVV